MGISEMPKIGQEGGENQHLTVSFGAGRADYKHSRSVSSASSSRTMLAQNPDSEGKKMAIRRRRTQVAVVKLSWWDCVKGFLFGPKNLKQKLAATVEIAELEDAGEDMFDHRECPFILTASVFPCPNSDIQRQEAKCVLDTGCLQGNIISAQFARRLGFTSFQPLKPREENGGTVATGHAHKVSGAVHVSWFTSTSAMVFRDMRFLVSESAQVDLVIGTHSIVRHRLISPPFLFTEVNVESNLDREKLAGEESKLKTELENLEEGSKKYKKKQKEYEAARIRLELHDAKSDMQRSRTERTKTALRNKIEGLEAELKKYLAKKETKGTSHK